MLHYLKIKIITAGTFACATFYRRQPHSQRKKGTSTETFTSTHRRGTPMPSQSWIGSVFLKVVHIRTHWKIWAQSATNSLLFAAQHNDRTQDITTCSKHFCSKCEEEHSIPIFYYEERLKGLWRQLLQEKCYKTAILLITYLLLCHMRLQFLYQTGERKKEEKKNPKQAKAKTNHKSTVVHFDKLVFRTHLDYIWTAKYV